MNKIEEELIKFKLYSKYNATKTLNENRETINEASLIGGTKLSGLRGPISDGLALTRNSKGIEIINATGSKVFTKNVDEIIDAIQKNR